MSTCLVTGGAGFIGSHLVWALVRRGESVRVLDDLSSGMAEGVASQAELRVGDVRDAPTVRAALVGCDSCIHLAALTEVKLGGGEWCRTQEVVLGGTLNVLEAAIRAGGIPVVLASSAAVYGEGTGEPQREDMAATPLSIYGASKLASELFAHTLALTHRLPSIALRLFNVYGPWGATASGSVVNRFVTAMVRDMPLQIYGDGKQTRDFIHVQDVVQAFLSAREQVYDGSPRFRLVNVCTGVATPISRVALIVAETLGRPLRIEHSALREAEPYRSCGAPDRMRSLLGIAPEIALTEGIESLVEEASAKVTSVGSVPICLRFPI